MNICKVCHKICSSPSGLSHHKRTHQGLLYCCNSCGKSYKTKPAYKKHQIKFGHQSSDQPSAKVKYDPREECFKMTKWRPSFECTVRTPKPTPGPIITKHPKFRVVPSTARNVGSKPIRAGVSHVPALNTTIPIATVSTQASELPDITTAPLLHLYG